MNTNLKKLVLCFIALLFFGTKSQAQELRYLHYIFPADSIKGFDEDFAKGEAFTRGFFGSEYHVFMYREKRNFINTKYGIAPNSGWLNRPGPMIVNAAPCINEGFESTPLGLVTSTLAGWTIAEGSNTNSCAMGGCCPTFPSNNAWCVATPLADTYIGTVPNSPLGGTKVLKMNDAITNKGEVVQITQTFPVAPTNALFQFAYMGVLNGSGHACCDQPYIRVTLEDCSANVLACPQVSITPPGPSCATVTATGWTTNTAGISWTPTWQVRSIDLTPYIGTCVKIKITIGDCDGWAHFGYGYVDCACLPMNIIVNSLVFPAGSNAVSVASCGAPTATMTAPPGLGPYVWNGPAGSGITNNTNQTITSSTSGQYTLSMNPLGVCSPITKTVTLTFAPNPTAGITYTNTCTTYTFTNTGSGPPSVQTFSFVGPGAPPTFTTTANQNTFNFAPTSTYTLYQVVTNTAGCVATASVVFTTPAGPNPGFTASPSYTQCFNTNAFTFNATTSAGTHTYSFASPVGAPPTGLTNPYGPVSFTAPGTYTVTHTINNAGCTTAASSVVVVNPNPTVVATWIPPACPTGAGTLNGGGLGAFTWTGPGGFNSTASSPTIIPTTAASGIYTLTSNYLGCIGTATVSVGTPTAPVVSLSSNGPVCVGSALTFSASFPTGASYFYWYSYVPTPYFYYYGGYNISNPTIAVTTTANAQTYQFYLGYPGCPTTIYTLAVSVVSPVTPTVSNTGPYCAGQTIQLNSNGGTGSAYSWSGPSSFTSAVQNATIAASTAAMSGVYTVTTGVGSCQKTGTTNVVVNPLPTPLIGSNSPVCLGSSINLTASGGSTFSWSGPLGFTSAVQNPTITNATTSMAGIYTATVTSASGCKNTGTVNVTVTTPTTTAANTGPYCVGATMSLSTPAATTYTWSGPGAFASNLQNPTQAGVTLAAGGVYTIQSTSSGCKATATTTVVINPLPTPAAANTGPYCAGSTIALNVNAYTAYSWTGPSAFSSILQNPNIAASTVANGGPYSVTVTDANGCKSTTTTTVVVNPIPVPIANSNSPVCLGAAINLTSNGGTTYSWSGPAAFSSALQNPIIASSAVTNAGVYTVTATSLGCSASQTVNVVVVTPTTNATNTGPYCAGATIQLNAPAAGTFTWTGPSAFSSSLQNPTRPAATVAMGGVYTVTAAIGTCSAVATTTVIVNALPVPVANSNSPVCVGQAINFTGTAASTYTWSGPASFASSVQNPNIPSAAATNAGVYTFSVTDVNGCKSGTTTNVVVNPLPIIAVANPTSCVGTAINLTANGGATYAWSGPGGFTSALQNPNIPSAVMANAGVYSVTVTTAAGCFSTTTANIGVTALPTPAIVSNTPCVGATLNLGASGGTSYNWSGPNVFSSTSTNPNINNVTMPANGTYTLTATSGTCTASTTAVIVVNALPNPNIVTNSPVCIGQGITFTGNGGSTYAWSGPGGFTSTSQNPNIPVSVMTNNGSYVLTVTDANGCVNTTNANVVVNPQPNVSASGGVACQGANTTLNANGGTSYSWTGPGGYTSNLQSPTLINLTPGNGGVYTVLVTDANTCTNTAVVTIVVNPAPTPNIQTNSPICLNNVLSFAGTGGVTYNWSGPMGAFSTSQTFTMMGSSTAMSGNYVLTVTDANGCSATTNANAVVNPLPTAAIVSGPNKGCAPICVTFTATSNPPVSGANWIMGDGSYENGVLTTQRCYQTAGIYTLSASVIDVNGCQGATTYTVEAYPKPTADFNYDPIKPIASVDMVNFTDASYGAQVANWNWYFMSNAQYTSNQQNPNFLYTDAGSYPISLIVTSDKGCKDSITMSILVGEDFGIYVPNAFTPNEDGLNDTFYPKGFGVIKYEITVFDRWGEKVFTSTDFNEAWDGTYPRKAGNEKVIKDGVYTWQIKVTSVFNKSHELTGHVTLIK